MKVLQINCVYGHGSTGVLVSRLHRYLQNRGWESLVCYGRGPNTTEVGVYRTAPEWYGKGNALLARLNGSPYGGCLAATEKLLRFIRKEKPNVVHLHCINGNFVNVHRLVSFLKENRIPTVVTLHAEFLYTGNCSHALDCDGWKTGCSDCARFSYDTGREYLRMAEAFRSFGNLLTVVSPSPWVRERAEAAPILREGRHHTVFNGVDTEIFSEKPPQNSGEEKVVFHATPQFRDDPDHLKGGRYVLELARRMEDLPIRFVVAGKYKISGELPPNVTLLGQIDDPMQLAQWYRRGNLTLLTSRRETFSMVCAESLCCGTSVVGFEAGGPESIALPDCSRFVPWGDTEALERAVRETLSLQQDRAAVSRRAAEVYGPEKMLRSYERIYLGG